MSDSCFFIGWRFVEIPKLEILFKRVRERDVGLKIVNGPELTEAGYRPFPVILKPVTGVSG